MEVFYLHECLDYWMAPNYRVAALPKSQTTRGELHKYVRILFKECKNDKVSRDMQGILKKQ